MRTARREIERRGMDARSTVTLAMAMVFGWTWFVKTLCARCVAAASRAAVECAVGAAWMLVGCLPSAVVMGWLNWTRVLRKGAEAGEGRRRTRGADPLGLEDDASGRTGKRRVCVVGGGGASGLTCVRWALEYGFDVVGYEKSETLGGVWAYGSSSSKVFNSVLQNVTKLANSFTSYPAPKSWPMYLGWRRTLEYLHGYADAFGLRDHVELRAEVTHVEKDEETGKFLVTVESSAQEGWRRVEEFDFVWVASGQLTEKKLPEVDGLDSFPGRVCHSVEYKTPIPFADQRVLIVGLGSASGSDIAQELAGIARSVTLIVRTERWIISRGIVSGCATLMNRIALYTPAWLGVLFHTFVDWYPFVHRVDPPGVTDSGDLLSAIALQKIKRAPGIDRVRGATVFFVDGSSAKFDAIIFATGFQQRYDFMPENLKPTARGLFEHCILPHEPRVGYVLFVLPFGTHWQLAESQAMLLALAHSGAFPLPSLETMCELSSPSVGRHEHLAEYFRIKYLAILAKYIYLPEKENYELSNLLRHPRFLWRLAWSPYIAPIREWGMPSDATKTRYSDSAGHMRTNWRGLLLNHRW